MDQPPSAQRKGMHSRPEYEPITMYSTPWCGDCYRAKRLFQLAGVPFVEVNIEEDEDAAELVMRVNTGMRSVPTIRFPDGTFLVEPASGELAAKLVPFAAPAEESE